MVCEFLTATERPKTKEDNCGGGGELKGRGGGRRKKRKGGLSGKREVSG